jgi:type IV pilus assembly protein PilA
MTLKAYKQKACPAKLKRSGGFTRSLTFRKKLVSGFTLLEILLVIGIIAILASIVILALNPIKMFSQVRNTQRKANLAEINKALYQYYIDNGTYPAGVPATNLGEICNTGATSSPHSVSCTGYVDLSPLVPTYLVAIPTDPQSSGTSTGYLVAKNSANKIYVKASNAELSQTIALGPSDGILPDHLVSYWSFDGNANDNWGSNNGTVTGATATTGVKGLSNTAYAFDGNDYIDISGISSSSLSQNTTGSVNFWIRMPDIYSEGHAVSISSWSGQTRMYIVPDMRFDRLSISLNQDSSVMWSYYTSTDTLDPIINNWGMITVTQNAISPVVYLNGVEKSLNIGTETDKTKWLYSIFTSATTKANISVFGAQATYGAVQGFFTGVVDNVRIYSKALSVEEILNIYNTEKP